MFRSGENAIIPLPQPRFESDRSVEAVLKERRSVRDFRPDPLPIQDVAQILWAAQGVTHSEGYRTAPSAGALYPLWVYLVAGAVEGLESGVYRYLPDRHGLQRIKNGDVRRDLAHAAVDQMFIAIAPVSLVIAAIYERTTWKYRRRGIQYVHFEVGHVGQNIYLQAVACDLATVAVGAFYDDQIREIVGMGKEELPLYLMPLGRPYG